MSRAKRLLIKTRELENKIRSNPYKFRTEITLNDIPEVEEIVYKEVKKEEVKELKKTKKKIVKVVEEVKEEEISTFNTKCLSIMRIDYRFPNNDMGLEMSLPEGIITTSGLQPGDYLEVLEGELEGRSLEVIEVLNSVTLRLDDVPTYSKAEEECKIRFIFNT